MKLNDAKQEVKERWREICEGRYGLAKKKVSGKDTYICPFCGHGSGGDGLTVNPKSKDSNGLKCFGSCEFSGDIIDLTMKEKGVDFVEAVKICCDELHIILDDPKPRQERIQDRRQPLPEFVPDPVFDGPGCIIPEKPAKMVTMTDDDFKATVKELIAARMKRSEEGESPDLNQFISEKQQLISDKENTDEYMSYVRKRHERENIIAGRPKDENSLSWHDDHQADFTEFYKRAWDGVSLPGYQRVTDSSYLESRGISCENAYKEGWILARHWISPTTIRKQRSKGSAWLPDPTERIIIPLNKYSYVARATDPNIKDYAKMYEGKAGLYRGKYLYEENSAVFVVEGAFDAISIKEVGAAAIALNSTSNTGLLVRTLEKKRTEATLILCLDNDKAGKKATEELRKDLDRLNISYIIAEICCGFKDPNEALVNDREGFVKAIHAAQAQTAARPDNTSDYIDTLMLSDIERMKAADNRLTGFEKLDTDTGGLYPGLYCVAATSSLGKTTFCLQLADNLAAAGHDVLFFSLEQSRLELVSKSFTRILASDQDGNRPAYTTSLRLRKGKDADLLKRAVEIYKKRYGHHMNIIEGNFNCNISFIGEYIRRYVKKNGGSPIVFIDYLQILQPGPDIRTNSEKEKIDKIVTELKRISRELELTVFIVSSVNRANYMTPIDFESLKESGGIEYTCDVIWGLQLECLNDSLFSESNKIKEKREKIRISKAASPREIELVCLKNRYGICNFSSFFNYRPETDTFSETYHTYDIKNLTLSETKTKKAGRKRG